VARNNNPLDTALAEDRYPEEWMWKVSVLGGDPEAFLDEPVDSDRLGRLRK
jgi:hypothetical protein